MNSDELRIRITDSEFGFEDQALTFRYTEKSSEDQKIERYQVLDDLGIVYSGERRWTEEEPEGFLSFFRETKKTYDEDIQKRSSYDAGSNSVQTVEGSWQDFREFLSDTEAEKYILWIVQIIFNYFNWFWSTCLFSKELFAGLFLRV